MRMFLMAAILASSAAPASAQTMLVCHGTMLPKDGMAPVAYNGVLIINASRGVGYISDFGELQITSTEDYSYGFSAAWIVNGQRAGWDEATLNRYTGRLRAHRRVGDWDSPELTFSYVTNATCSPGKKIF